MEGRESLAVKGYQETSKSTSRNLVGSAVMVLFHPAEEKGRIVSHIDVA